MFARNWVIENLSVIEYIYSTVIDSTVPKHALHTRLDSLFLQCRDLTLADVRPNAFIINLTLIITCSVL